MGRVREWARGRQALRRQGTCVQGRSLVLLFLKRELVGSCLNAEGKVLAGEEKIKMQESLCTEDRGGVRS